MSRPAIWSRSRSTSIPTRHHHFIQDRAITHNDPADPIETGASAATLAAGLVVLTATVTDGDLDTATATADIGDAFRFEDDGPSISRNATRSRRW